RRRTGEAPAAREHADHIGEAQGLVMEMTSTRQVSAPRDAVWVALNDPNVLKGCIPGCESIEPDGENGFKIAMATRVGAVSAKFNGRMRLSALNPPHGYTLSFDGQGGAAGFAKG